MPPMSSPERRERPAMTTSRPLRRAKSTIREYAEALGVALLLALVIRTFVIQAFKIPSGSMLPTLEVGDHILVNKFIYGGRLEVPLTQMSFGQLPALRKPRAGDVVVFIWPKDRAKDFIKRVIATEGQTIEMRNREVLIDGRPLNDPHAVHDEPRAGPADSYGPYTVPAGHVFVMGDNRDHSFDSRYWGPVPLADIKGQALIIYWSWGGEPGRWVRWDRIGRLVY
jgi:signal peptidase I